MRLSLFASILLLVPLAFANQQLVKIIYSDGYLISESSINVTYGRHDSKLVFYLKDLSDPLQWSMVLSDANLITKNDVKVSFVLEAFLIDARSLSEFGHCKFNSDLELRGMITHCHGPVRLRQLTFAETNQMKKFKSDSRETDIALHLSYDKQRFVTHVAQPSAFYLDVMENQMAAFASYSKEEEGMMFILDGYADKRFVVEGPVSESEDNFGNPPVDGLKGLKVFGNFKISQPSAKDDEMERLRKALRTFGLLD